MLSCLCINLSVHVSTASYLIEVIDFYLRLERLQEYGGPDLTVGLHVVRIVAAPEQPVRDAHQIRLHFVREVFDLLRLLVR